jgi:drug/metabolite transporter (DMT)-like permease
MDSRPAKRGASGIVLILLTLLGWSSVTLFLKHFTSYIDAWTANGWRYGMSALFWAPVLGWGLWRRTLPDGLWRAALVPSLFNLAAQICFALAPYYINPGLIAFLLRLQIVFIAVGAYVLFPAERPVLRSPTYVCGVVIVFTGLMGLCFLGEKLPRGATALGIALAVAAGILYSGYFLGVRYYVHHISPIVSFATISLYTATGVVILMLLKGRDYGAAAWSLPWGQFGMLVASAFAGIAISHVMYYAAIVRIGLALCAGVILLQPVITSTASYFLFHERLTLAQWLSGVTAIGGAVIMLYTQRRLAQLPISPPPPD